MLLLRHGQSVFNLHYNATGIDPGVIDAPLTDLGRQQARAAAEKLRGKHITRIVASPYSRAVETALLATAGLGIGIEVEPLIGEWGIESCNIGSPPAELADRFPGVDFAHVGDHWWPRQPEPESGLIERCRRFITALNDGPHADSTLVVCHWGVIRCMTGYDAANCELVRGNPRQPAYFREETFLHETH